MLARICMTLQPEEICSLVSAESRIKVRWIKEKNLGLKYSKLQFCYFPQGIQSIKSLFSAPSCNIAPGEVAPIIISSQHFDSDDFFYTIHPALWGLDFMSFFL
jgi:hypothetical protein